MLPIYMIPRQEFGLRKKHLRPIHLFSGFVLMRDTARQNVSYFGQDMSMIFSMVLCSSRLSSVSAAL